MKTFEQWWKENNGGLCGYANAMNAWNAAMEEIGILVQGISTEDRYSRKLAEFGVQYDCEPDKVKPLAQWIDEWDLEHPDERNTREYFQQALDAYESTEQVKIRIERA